MALIKNVLPVLPDVSDDELNFSDILSSSAAKKNRLMSDFKINNR